jgi:TonB family protein
VFGEGGLGVSGPGRSSDGEQGIGVGSIGGLSQPSTAQAGAVVPGKPVVMGSLDKEIIRRVVRQHRNEIRYCYEKSLVKDPSLGGKVDVKFVISATGSVASAVVAQSTVGDKDVEGCIAKKVRRWVFPAPKGGGVVIVRYPFVFTSGAKAKAKAKAAPSAPARRGSLDKSAIQRVVRKHRNEVRYCYENELKKDPELAGMVKVKFVIGVTGSVESASVSSSTVGSDAVGECVVRSISKWVFPAPKGNGSVSVVYPFKFSS